MISNDPGEMLHVSELDDEFELFYPFMDRRLILFFRPIESEKAIETAACALARVICTNRRRVYNPTERSFLR